MPNLRSMLPNVGIGGFGCRARNFLLWQRSPELNSIAMLGLALIESLFGPFIAAMFASQNFATELFRPPTIWMATEEQFHVITVTIVHATIRPRAIVTQARLYASTPLRGAQRVGLEVKRRATITATWRAKCRGRVRSRATLELGKNKTSESRGV